MISYYARLASIFIKATKPRILVCRFILDLRCTAIRTTYSRTEDSDERSTGVTSSVFFGHWSGGIEDFARPVGESFAIASLRFGSSVMDRNTASDISSTAEDSNNLTSDVIKKDKSAVKGWYVALISLTYTT